MQNKYAKWIALVVVLVVILIVVSVINKNHNNSMTQNSQTAQPSTSVTSDEGTTNDTGSTSAPSSASKAYEAALVTYAKTRFQFNDTCVATPANMTVKSGTKIMLDNRGKTSEKITVDGVAYTVGAYNYAVVTAPRTTGAAITAHISCGKAVNVSTLLVEK